MKKQILVVDDSAIMRKKLSLILEELGHDVIAKAVNGVDAYKKYVEFKPDLVAMDISMPVLDGVEATKKIISEFKDAKIIIISSINQENSVFNAIESGALHYMVKPINKAKTKSVIDSVLGIDNGIITAKERQFIIFTEGNHFSIEIENNISQKEKMKLKEILSVFLLFSKDKIKFVYDKNNQEIDPFIKEIKNLQPITIDNIEVSLRDGEIILQVTSADTSDKIENIKIIIEKITHTNPINLKLDLQMCDNREELLKDIEPVIGVIKNENGIVTILP